MSLTPGSILKWVKLDPGKLYYELRDDDNVLSSLEWKSDRSQDSEGTAGDKRLSFKRKGFFFHQTSVIDRENGSELAVFKFYGGDKGELAFSGGRTFKWKFEGLMQSQWFFTTNAGRELLCFTVPPARKSAVLRTAADVEILRSMDSEVLTLLAVIGWYNLFVILSAGL